jgi:hypothetical protein
MLGDEKPRPDAAAERARVSAIARCMDASKRATGREVGMKSVAMASALMCIPAVQALFKFDPFKRDARCRSLNLQCSDSVPAAILYASCVQIPPGLTSSFRRPRWSGQRPVRFVLRRPVLPVPALPPRHAAARPRSSSAQRSRMCVRRCGRRRRTAASGRRESAATADQRVCRRIRTAARWRSPAMPPVALAIASNQILETTALR